MTGLSPLVVWGTKGQAKVLAEFAEAAGYRIDAFFDNDRTAVSPIPAVPVYHGDAGLDRYLREHDASVLAFVVAIGGDRGRDRLEVQRRLENAGLRPATLIHPTAFVARDAAVGPGSHVLVRACVCTRARLGAACIVNTAASVDHECDLGDGVHIGPGATLAGCVSIGEAAFVGAGAVILPNLTIGSGAVIAAGAVVIDDVEPGWTVAGVPAVRITSAARSGA